MKRKSIIFVLTVLLLGPIDNNKAYAQILLMEGDENSLREEAPVEVGGFVLPGITPDHDTTYDYTPIGDGVLLLGVLGGAYLLSKRKKK